MTRIHIGDYSEVNSPSWTYETLRPPRLTPYNIWKDLYWHYKLYKESQLKYRTIAVFLILRILQRFSYNVGWNRGVDR